MTTPHQAFQDRLHGLLTTPGPSRVLVQTPAGSGLMSTLVRVVQTEVEAGRRVFVIANSRVGAEQWSSSLHSSGISDIWVLFSASDALVALDDSGPSRMNVMISTTQLLNSEVTRRAAASQSPSLLIIELPSLTVEPQLEMALQDLLERTPKAVAIANPLGTFDWFQADVIETISPIQALGELPADYLVALAEYETTPAEVDIYDRARTLLSSQEPPVGWRLPNSRPAVHARLLRQVARDSGQSIDDESSWEYEDVSFTEPEPTSASTDELWRLLDEIESLGPDPKLEATIRLVEQAFGMRPVVVVADSLVEVDYITSGLEERGLPAIALSGVRSHGGDTASDENSILVLARGRQGYHLSKKGTEEIWWSQPPDLMTAVRRLTESAPESRVVVPIPVPPSLEDEGWLALVEELKELGVVFHTIDL